MINLRYHIVSIAAVFIALALGVIAGTTVINPGIVNGLRRLNIARSNTLTQQRALNAQQRSALQVWQSFGATLLPTLTRDGLKGMKLFLVEQDGTDETVASGVEAAVKTAGALDSGRVVFLKKMRLTDDAARAQLAADVGTASTVPSDVETAAAAALAARLTSPADPSTAGDLLGALQRDGFIALRGVVPGVFPSRGEAIVYLWNGAQDAFPDPSSFVLPFLSAIPARTLASVAEPLSAAISLCTRVRDNDQLAGRIAGVDDVDLIPGQISLVSALHDVAAGLPAPQYGVKSGATAPGPQTSPS